MKKIPQGKIVYLVGVNHEVQSLPKPAEIVGFVVYLEKCIKRYNPDLLAEEYSKEALRLSRIESTTVQGVARSRGIKHLFCDPESEERRKLGIPSRGEIKCQLGITGPVSLNSAEDKRIKEEQKKYHPIREAFWAKCLEEETFETALFVCGSDHLGSFGPLLKKRGYGIHTSDRQFDSV